MATEWHIASSGSGSKKGKIAESSVSFKKGHNVDIPKSLTDDQ